MSREVSGGGLELTPRHLHAGTSRGRIVLRRNTSEGSNVTSGASRSILLRRRQYHAKYHETERHLTTRLPAVAWSPPGSPVQHVQHLPQRLGQGSQIPVIHSSGVQLGDQVGQRGRPRPPVRNPTPARPGRRACRPRQPSRRPGPRRGQTRPHGRAPRPGVGTRTCTTSATDPSPDEDR
jgi:hypothetical protein